MISIVIFITGCTIKLAPDYDKDLVDTLIVTNAKTMEFFASIVDGTKAEEFSKREKTYNKLIGQFDALALQAGARPIPNNDITEKINRHLEDRGINVVDDGTGPSATAMQKISETLQKLRSTDKKQGVTRLEVAAFKGQVSIYMDQALTYEQFLER
jgi:hypothetical protein